METVLKANALRKSFGGFRALDGLDLIVERGTVHGFLGPNGAGKTTTLKIIVGLLRPDAGSINIFGYQVGAEDDGDIRSRIGYMPQAPRFPGYMTGIELLKFYTGMYDFAPDEASSAISWALATAGLVERQNDRIGHYSGGMVQRLGLAQALLFHPEFVILDEPSAGLDPAGMAEFRGIVKRARDEGMTVLLSSHLLHEVEQVSDQVSIIDRGRLVASGSMTQIAGLLGAKNSILVEVDNLTEKVLAAVRGLTFVEEVDADGKKLTIHLRTADDVRSHVSQTITGAGGVIKSMANVGQSLEDLYMGLVAGGQRGAE